MTTSFLIRNTLGVTAHALSGARVESLPQLCAAQAAAKAVDLPIRYIGAGSNILPHATVAGFVCEVAIPGIECLVDAQDYVHIKVGAGEDWHALVMHCLENGWYGLENLALIPGCVGAAPVQNIGAYGRELADFLLAVETVDAQGVQHDLPVRACEFAYRDSWFKRHSDVAITGIYLRLSKRPVVSLEYAELAAQFSRESSESKHGPTPREVADAVIALRQKKLPDPASHPNVGSFFKNPIVSKTLARRLAAKVAGLVSWPYDEAHVKLSAAQLIDRAGWKSKGTDWVGCWPTQPLVLVNRGTANVDVILAFASAIQTDIAQRYDISLELEPVELV